MSALGAEVEASRDENKDIVTRMLEANRAWQRKTLELGGPEFFQALSQAQHPEVAFIGCSDSRVPAERITGLKPGELFVHRNIANVMGPTDVSALSFMQYAVHHLHVKHIIVCGHYKCGGVAAALSGVDFDGVLDTWLEQMRHLMELEKSHLEKISDPEQKLSLLCELNVANSVRAVCRSPIVKEAWKSGHKLAVHGWIYDLNTGLINDLGIVIDGPDQVNEAFKAVVMRRMARLWASRPTDSPKVNADNKAAASSAFLAKLHKASDHNTHN
jgi:carbonic anhydrase